MRNRAYKNWTLPLLMAIAQIPPNLAQAATRLDSEPQIVGRGPHQQLIQYTTQAFDENGAETLVTNSYVQVQTGLNRWDETLKTYVPASASIRMMEGYAVIENAQYQAVFSRNANDPNGLIDLFLPGGERLITQPIGLALTEPDTGNSIFLGELQDSEAVWLDENTIIYPNAFDLVDASIVIRSRLNGIESDVLLQENITDELVLRLGLNPQTARLEAWHQVLGKPAADVKANAIVRSDGKVDTDKTIHLPQMVIGAGTAFLRDDAELPPEIEIPVAKDWIRLEGIDFLIESVPLSEAKPFLEKLPARNEARVIDKKAVEVALAKARRKLDGSQVNAGDSAQTLSAVKQKPISIASFVKLRGTATDPAAADHPRTFASFQSTAKGFLIDFPVTLTNHTNLTFKGDTTYWITGAADLYGTTILEGGAVIKFTNYTTTNPVLTVYGPFKCETSPYNPAIFTAKDDNTVGDTISGSTGTPLTSTFYSWYNLRFLNSDTNTVFVHDIQSRYSHVGVGFQIPTAAQVWNLVVYNCDRAVETYQSDIHIKNALLNRTRYAFNVGNGASQAIRAEHLTINSAQKLLNYSSGSPQLFLTNTLVCTVTNSPTTGISSNSTYAVSSSAFASLGRGNHYLADSAYRNLGSTNLSAATKAILKATTTYAPSVLTNAISTATTLSPVVQRDTDAPDLGYHYPPVDYFASSVPLTSTLTLINGVCVGVYGPEAFTLNSDSKFFSEGSPARMNQLFRYEAVQEDPTTRWGGTPDAFLEMGSSEREIRLRFTRVNHLARGASGGVLLSFFAQNNNAVTPFAISDSEIRGIRQTFNSFQTNSAIALADNVFHNCVLTVQQGFFSPYTYKGLSFSSYNNLFKNGSLGFLYNTNTSTWTVRDNLFDSDTLSTNGSFSASHNAYRVGLTNYLGGSGNKTNVVTDYVPGPLGPYYYASSGGGLSQLINTGSRNATNAGLYHFTTVVATGTKETNSFVDIGFHYVGVNASGVPLDSDGDTIPDYLEDRNGNGAVNVGETDWQTTYNSIGGLSGTTGLQTFTPLKN